MIATRRPLLISLAVVAYCGWQSLDLLGAWRASPFERFGWIALLLWLVPIFARYASKTGMAGIPGGSSVLLWAGLGLSFVGTIGEVNALHYAGLACALAGTLPWSWRQFPWLLSAIAWMPVFGYFVSHQFPNLVLPGRLVLAALVAGWTTWDICSRTKSVS